MVTILRPHRPEGSAIDVAAPAEATDASSPPARVEKGTELGKKDSSDDADTGTGSAPGEGPNPTA